MYEDEDPTDRLMQALRHRLRREILRRMPDEGKISPSELAPGLDESLSNVSYHCRMLERSPVVELVEEVQVRGVTQHFYQRTLADHDWVRKLLEEPEDWGV